MDKKRIIVRSIEFSDPPFRKLKNIKIDFSERLTIIAGHNGIGKSTILGLVANTFGLARGPKPRSYFGEAYFANIEKIIYLALDEVAKAQEHPTSAPVVTADVQGETVKKRCAMTQRTEWKRARVVPRSIEKSDEPSAVGPDAKIPLPTIYLGLKRFASIGEADEEEVDTKTLKMQQQDSQLMIDFVNSIILGDPVTDNITHQSIKGSKKRTAQPGYMSHDALAISMGQDSLGSIATALASFNQLKRESGDDYPGGLLIIDELDVGFHPHAIDRLISALKNQAKVLDLQIIATTHSPRLIEAVHPEGGGNSLAPDSVIYLLDTRHPRLAEDQSLKAILDDMAQRHNIPNAKPTSPLLTVYFEDTEGMQFFNSLISPRKRAAIGRKHGVRISLIPLGIPGSNLIALPNKDPIFQHRILVADADITIPQKSRERGNVIKLPCTNGASGTDRSPENTIKNFLRSISRASEGPLHIAMRQLSVPNPSSDKIETAFFTTSNGNGQQRDRSKAWWSEHWDLIDQWGVIREWAACNKLVVEQFINDFESAVKSTAAHVK